MLIRFLILCFLSNGVHVANAANTTDKQGDFPVSARDSFQSRTSIGINAQDGHYFVTWSDITAKSTTDVDVYGLILDATGKAISKDIAIASRAKGQALTAVAFDNINRRYLVIWSDWRKATAIDSDIWGQFVNTDGSLHGGNFVISEVRGVSQKDSTIAFDPSRQQYLIVWKDSRRGGMEKLRGRYINSTGKPKGNEFDIALGEGKQDRPSLYYDPKRKRFLVIWRDIVDDNLEKTTLLRGKGIFSSFIDPATPHKAKPGKLIDMEDDACLPTSLYAAAYSPEDDVFLVAWTTARDYQKLGLDSFGAIMRADSGSLIKKPFAIARTNDYQEFPTVTYDGRNKRFLAVWYDLRRDHSARNTDIYGRFISPAGKMDDEFLISDINMRGTKRFPIVAYNEKQDAYLVIWQDQRNKTAQKRYVKIYGKLKRNNKNLPE